MSAIHELDETDPVLGRLLGILKDTPERDPHAARDGKMKYLAELDELFPAENLALARPRRIAPAKQSSLKKGSLADFFRSLLAPPRLIWAPLAIAAIVLAFLTFTGVATARVAADAIPGDTLYTLKTSLEQAELAVVTDPVEEASLNVIYAERRLVEANLLAANGRIGETQALLFETDARMKSAYATLLAMQQTNPEQAALLRSLVMQRLAHMNGLVDALAASAPPAFGPAIDSVMASVENFIPEAGLPTPNPGTPIDGQGENTANSNSAENGNQAPNCNDDGNDASCGGEDLNGNHDNNNADGPDNNNGAGQENNNGNGPDNNNGNGPDNNNGNGPDNNNGNGPDNNNGNQPPNGGDDSGDSGGGNDGDDSGDSGGGNGGDDNDDGNNGGGNDDKEKNNNGGGDKKTP